MLVSEELVLPCGLALSNRLCKVALAEQMSPSHNPGEEFPKAYGEWADGGWGLVITGNVLVSLTFMGTPKDVALPASPSDQAKQAWKVWADTCQAKGTATIVQLNHPGRQSPLGAGKKSIWTKNVAPSAVKLNFGPNLIERAIATIAFGTPRSLTGEEIEEIIEMFVNGAKMAEEAGFKGIQIHAAHGYLLAQFMSPKTNLRTDEFGGTAVKRVEIVLRIMKGIRGATKKGFCVGIKLNSVDVSGPDLLEDTLEQIGLIIENGIDFIEISGGTYEEPLMMQVKNTDIPASAKPSQRTIERESFFIQFAETVRQRFPSVILMVTGGFRTRVGMERALQSKACDLIGLGRPGAALPKLPKEIILNDSISDEAATVRLKKTQLPWWESLTGKKIAGAGAETIYYSGQIQRMGKGLPPIESRA
ncbi:NADH:flavin oxidoreductase/NADH oxidase-like protein [Bisporella sp. PMI_857]|nr:NADH:flavin oxidoreductase/NADH oxidase-like protein [Bisporella sp. PMI_857]